MELEKCQCRLGPRWRSHVAGVPPPYSAFSRIMRTKFRSWPSFKMKGHLRQTNHRLFSGKGSPTASRPGRQSMLFSVNYFFHFNGRLHSW